MRLLGTTAKIQAIEENNLDQGGQCGTDER